MAGHDSDRLSVEKVYTESLHEPGCLACIPEVNRTRGPRDERLSFDDDGEYLARVVTKCERRVFVPEARVCFRRASAGSLSRSVSDKAFGPVLLSLRLCFSYLRSVEDSDRPNAMSLKFLQACIARSTVSTPTRRICSVGSANLGDSGER